MLLIYLLYPYQNKIMYIAWIALNIHVDVILSIHTHTMDSRHEVHSLSLNPFSYSFQRKKETFYSSLTNFNPVSKIKNK